MPSASNKTENKAPPEANDPFKAAQSVVEKKVRNLEKRKGKLDAIREKRDQGEKLNADQQKAIDAYDAVITSLEVTKDLQKQFTEIQTDIDKALKKQARKDKKERAEKRAADVRRIQDVLQLQSLLDCMGTEQVRSHFMAGKHNAKVLTEENFTQLDELYKLISPIRDETNFEEQLNTAAEHMYSYLEARDAEAAGSTYGALKTLVDEITLCGYFDKYPYEEKTVVVEEPAAAPPPPVVEPEPEVKQEKVHEEPPQKVVEQHVEEPAQTVVVEPVVQQAVQQVQQTVPHAAPDMAPQQLLENADPTQFAEEDSFFSMPTFPPTDQRPFQEIVSSVQGTFNFLQESQIASDNTAPHHDPAVVAAKPMASSLHKSQTEQMRGTSFQGVSMLGNDDLTQQLAQSTQQQVSAASDRLGDSSSQQSAASHDAAYTASQQDYIHTYGEHGSALGHTHSHTHSGMDQSVVMGTGMSAGQDMPHSIPLPNQSNIQDQSHDSQGKKPFTMNPNAAMFQSMYNSSISHNQTNNSQMSQPMGNTSSSNNMNNDKGMNQQNEYHSNGFGNNYRSGGPRGGPRGGGGSRGGRGGMSNGYARNGGGSRGGGGAPYNSSGRGGGFNSRGGGGRGGTYHGYPPRSDYHPEGGYQGLNNAYNGGSGFRRGGSGGAGSSSGPSDSGAGGMRGGPPRGGGGERGERGARGPPRGGYSRPPVGQTTA